MSVVYYDATLILGWGAVTPVGLIRIEHHLVDYLLTKSNVVLEFVRFDKETSAYVLLTSIERNTVQTLLDQAKGHNRHCVSPPPPVEQLNTQEATGPGASQSKFRQLCRTIVNTPVDQGLSQLR